MTYLCPTCSQPLRREPPTSKGEVPTLWCEHCHLIFRDWPPITRGLRLARGEEVISKRHPKGAS